MHSIWYQMLKIALASGAPPQTPMGEGVLTTLPIPPIIVVRNFLPSAISPLCTINASILQGSGLGPTDIVIAISKYSRNRLPKYADDSYLQAGPCFLH